MKPKTSLSLIESEFTRANNLYPGFHSNHEAYAVIKEEFDELWDEIRKEKGVNGNDQIRNELIQIGAMVVKYLENLC